MKVITTHLSADFDAFAGAVCCARLYPGYRVLFPGSQEAAVRRFLAETRLPFPELKLKEARRRTWTHAVVVDTRTPSRLGEAWEIIARDRCPITLIDHHVTEEEGLGAAEVVSRPVGATCTLISSLFTERSLEPTREEASLLLMGIYEDTGGLAYGDTTPEDLRAVAWLLEQGGALSWVRKWVLKGLRPEQLELLNRLVEGTEEVKVRGVPVAFSMVEVDHYHEEAAYVVHRWVETFELPVGIAMLVRPPHTNLILRSHVPELHVGRIAQAFGGGGHATAASARVSDRMPVEVREELLHLLEVEMPPPATAADLAVTQIFTVATTTSVIDAKQRLNQLRVNALPVEAEGGGGLVGMVTRQILDRAQSLGLGDRPVHTVMQPSVPTVEPDTPLEVLRDLFLERSYRFVVVEREGRPWGLVTRMELLRRLFGGQHEAGSPLDNRMAGARPVAQPIAGLIGRVAPAWVQGLLTDVRRVADELSVPVYLVGGVVRDLLLGRANEDLDLVVEGGGIELARALAAAVGGRCHPHEPFMTAVVTLPDGHRVDVVSARTEFYRTPAALPEVATSLIRQDLYRRDFTVNALAIVLSGDRFGELVDFFGGRKDLQRREIRVLHSLSFIDDPTRIVRAARYSRRLAFAIAPDTRHLIATALREGVFARLSGQRLRRELEHLLAEPHPAESLALLSELQVLTAISDDLGWDSSSHALLLELEGQVAWYRLVGLGAEPDPLVLYLGCLLLPGGGDACRRFGERLQLSRPRRERLAALPQAEAALRRVADGDLKPSDRVRHVEAHPVEAVLVAMAGLGLEARRRLAAALEASARVRPPVTGRQLLRAGIPQGPHVGDALKRTRDALIDGEITPERALEHAAATAIALAGLVAPATARRRH